MKTIKVKETKTFTKQVRGHDMDGVPEWTEVPVAEAKLVLVECKSGESMFKSAMPLLNPILISKTEKIEEGDQAIDYENSNEIFTVAEVLEDCFIDTTGKTRYTNNDPHQCYKVLSLPEHFSHKLIQDIVDGKLKEGDSLLVECVGTCTNCGESHEDSVLCYDTVNFFYDSREEPFYIKLNPSGHITLHKLEEKKLYSEGQLREAMRASLGFSSYREIDIYISKLMG